MSSLSRETGLAHEMADFMDTVCREFGQAYERRPLELSVTELGALVPGLDELAPAEQVART
jgi:hypothetical protein